MTINSSSSGHSYDSALSHDSSLGLSYGSALGLSLDSPLLSSSLTTSSSGCLSSTVTFSAKNKVFKIVSHTGLVTVLHLNEKAGLANPVISISCKCLLCFSAGIYPDIVSHKPITGGQRLSFCNIRTKDDISY